MSNVEFLPDGRRLADLRVVDLKEELDKLGMPKNGSKSVLMQRLQEALTGRATAPAPQQQSVPQQVNPLVQQYLEDQKRMLEANRQAAETNRSPEAGISQNQNNHGVASTPGVVSPTVQHNAPSAQQQQQIETVKQVGRSGSDSAAESDKSERHLRSPPVSSPPSVREVRVGGAETETKRSQMPVPGIENVSVGGKEATADVDRSSRRRSAKEPEARPAESVAETVHDEPKSSTADAGLGGDEVVIGEEQMDDLEDIGEEHKTKKNTKSVDRPKPASPVKAVQPETTVKPPTASIPLTKPANSETAASAEKGDKPARKRKWGTTTAGSRTQAVAISSDSLKDIVGTVSASDIKSLEEKEQPVVVTRIIQNGDVPADRRVIPTKRIVLAKTEEGGEEAPTTPAATDEKPKEIKYTDENLIRVQTPSPAHSPVSKVVHVRGLVRPFTVKALHELLRKFGSFNTEKDFWIDNVKSRCIVKYETEEQATKARDGLHRVQWPTTNEASLRVDFGKEEELEEAVIYSKPQERKPVVESDQNRRPEESAEGDRKNERDRRLPRSGSPGRIRRSAEREKQIWPREREWDRGKDSQQTERNRARSRSKSPLERDRKRRSSQSPRSQPAAGEKKEEVPAKLLDELFKKTKVLPSVYWLPLTDEQVIAREREREERRKARRQQLEEEDKMNQQQRGRQRVDRRRASRTPTPERYFRRR